MARWFSIIATLAGSAVFCPAQKSTADPLPAAEAEARACRSGAYADRFIWPVKGQSVAASAIANNIQDPRTDGWYVSNGVGHNCPICADIGNNNEPFHPGNDYDKLDGTASQETVYAPANGVVVRLTPDDDNNGQYLMLASCLAPNLPQAIDWKQFAIPGTSTDQISVFSSGNKWVTF